MEAKTTLNVQFLRACNLIAAKQDIRYYLNGVFVEIGEQETRYVSTDGHKALILRDEREKLPAQVPSSLIIPSEAIAMLPRKGLLGVLGVDLHYGPAGGEARLGDVFFKPIDGKFPDYRKVVPEGVSGEPGTFNVEYMLAFQRAAALAFGARSYNAPTFLPNGREGVALVLVEGYPDFVGLIMPMRALSEASVPAWLAKPKAANAPEAMAAAD